MHEHIKKENTWVHFFFVKKEIMGQTRKKVCQHQKELHKVKKRAQQQKNKKSARVRSNAANAITLLTRKWFHFKHDKSVCLHKSELNAFEETWLTSLIRNYFKVVLQASKLSNFAEMEVIPKIIDKYSHVWGPPIRRV